MRFVDKVTGNHHDFGFPLICVLHGSFKKLSRQLACHVQVGDLCDSQSVEFLWKTCDRKDLVLGMHVEDLVAGNAPPGIESLSRRWADAQ